MILTAPAPDLADLEEKLVQVSQEFEGRLGATVIRLRDGRRIHVRGDERFPSASTIKTAVMVEAFRRAEQGSLSMKDQLTVPPQARRSASMWTYFLREDTKVNIDGLISLMMTYSDNTATVMLSDHLGVEAMANTLTGFGLTDTAVTINVPQENVRLRRLRETFANMGVTTPNQMARLFQLIHQRKAASPAACEKMIRIMTGQYWDDFIAYTVPPKVAVAAKTGALNRSRSEVALVYGPEPYTIAIYTDHQKDQRWTDDNAGNEAIRKISSMVWNHLNPGHTYAPPAGSERWFPTGGGVDG